MDDEPKPPPSWASFMSPEQFALFDETLQGVVSEVEHEWGERIVSHLEAGYVMVDATHYGLRNMAQSCLHHGKPQEWARVIRDLFDLARTTELSAGQFRDFATHEQHLKLRLYARSDIPPAQHQRFVMRAASQTGNDAGQLNEDPEDLLAILVIDTDKAVVSVEKSWAAEWNKEPSELFALALANIAREDTPTVDDFNAGEGVKVRSLLSQSFFIASHALHLSRFVDPSEYGLIVALPHRHVILIHRIVDHHVVDAMEIMAPIAIGMHAEGPGSISDQLFWWRDGRLLRLPSSTDENGQRKLQLPAAFVTGVLSTLMQEN
ncbi:MAG: hypothetical protein ACI9KE_003578 [Polyangiales bacterium]|jgi:hypothetical protein